MVVFHHVKLEGDAGVDPGLTYRDYISHVAWEFLGMPQEQMGKVAVERSIRGPLPSLLPLPPDGK